MRMQSAPGSVGQVREAATQLLFAAKSQNVPIFVVGHITKDGALAGPKTLEHVVDTVLYFEGERHHSHRVVRAVKNRFGAVSELGVFEMTSEGLLAGAQSVAAVPGRSGPTNTPGSAVHCSIEGSRPLLVEVQALVSAARSATRGAWPTASTRARLSLLLAVLEKRAGLHSGSVRTCSSTSPAACDSRSRRPTSAWPRPWRPACATGPSPRPPRSSGRSGWPARVRGIPQAGLRVQRGGPARLPPLRAAAGESRPGRPDPGRWRVRS